MIPKTIVACVSGGFDSVVGLYDLCTPRLMGTGWRQHCLVHCVLFDYKQKHVQELLWAKHHCHRMGVNFTTIELPQLRGSTLTDGKGGPVVPGRNAVFLSHAVNLAVAAGADTVVYFCNKDDEAMFPDCRRAFVHTYNNMLRASGVPVEVCAPYIDKAKWEIADLGRQLGVNFDETWSCYEGGLKPCGKCIACLKREEALKHK